MTEEQAEGLRRLAALRRRSQASLLRDALDNLIDADERIRRADAARSVIGAFVSSGDNAAVDHDAELEAAYLS